MTGLKQALAPKFGQNRQIDIKTGETSFGPVNSKFPNRFYTIKTISRHLIYALSMSLVIGFIIITIFRMLEEPGNFIIPVVMLCGIDGGFVGFNDD